MERVSVEEFRQSGLQRVTPVTDDERVPLEEALGRVASRRVLAAHPLPAFRRSSVDGYALRASDQGRALSVVAKVTAGHPTTRVLNVGEAIEITTGAPMPDGADAVGLVEESDRDGDRVIVREAVAPGAHVSQVGEDFQRSQVLLEAGQVITSVEVAALASQGLSAHYVYRRPRVAILSTGDELVPPGAKPGLGQVYDVNGAALEAMVRAAGGDPLRLGVLPDQYQAVKQGLLDAIGRPDWDMLITSGGTGASVPVFQGLNLEAMHDLIPAVMMELGDLIHHGIRMVPGRPTALAVLAGRPVFCLPGWPYAVLIHFEVMVLPALRKLGRLPPSRRLGVRAVLTDDLLGTPGFTRVIQVRLMDAGGVRQAKPLLQPPPPSASRVMTQMLQADGYMVVEDGETLASGSVIEVQVDPLKWKDGYAQVGP